MNSRSCSSSEGTGIARALRISPLFSSCSLALLEALSEQFEVRTARRREIIVEQGHPFPYLGLVLNGVLAVTVCVTRPSRTNPRHFRLYEAFRDSTFAEVLFLDSSKSLGNITVISAAAKYALIHRDALKRIASADAALMDRLEAQAASRMHEATTRLTSQAIDNVPARLARILLQFTSSGEGLQPAHAHLRELTQSDMAAAIGTVKEVCARAIATLEKAGALARDRGHIHLLDRKALSDCAADRRSTSEDVP